VRHGPVCKTQDKDLWKYMTQFLRDYTKKHRALFFRVSPLIQSEYNNLLVDLGYQSAAIHAMDAEYCWVLPLVSDEESLLKEMRKTTRYEIKRAEKMGVEVIKTTALEEYHYFETLYKETAQRQGFVPHTGIKEEFELFSKEQQAMLFLGKYEGEILAAAIILFTGTQGIYHHGASLSNRVPASYLIQWEAIKEAKKRGMNQYNFWGIAPPNIEHHPWSGITLFKKGFGGHEQQYLHAHDFPVSRLYVVPKSVETIRKMRKGY
jgi:lipid II:glycine glycyltransferase (peptidoglycan interpeptide bridge formation enzyme)